MILSNACQDSTKFLYATVQSRRGSAVSDNSAYIARSSSSKGHTAPATKPSTGASNDHLKTRSSELPEPSKTGELDKDRRHSEYGQFLSPDVLPGIYTSKSLESQSGELNTGSSCFEGTAQQSGETLSDTKRSLDGEVASGERSPVQAIARRRAVDTSDLRSCALVQSKLKSHRSSWKSIDGSIL